VTSLSTTQTYEAKIIDYFCREWNGQLKLVVMFQTREPPEQISWECFYSSPAAQRYANAMLKLMGSKGQFDYAFADGPGSKFLDQTKPYYLTVEIKTTKMGKEFAVVKSIKDNPEESKGNDRLSPETVKNLLSSSADGADKGSSSDGLPF
jgi:hypothetical protein